MNCSMMRSRPYLILFFFAALFLSSCTESYQEYCTFYPVTFTCDITYAPFNTVNSMGQFLTIRMKSNHTSYTVTNVSTGHATEIPLTEMEARTFSFGLGGLILGQPYFGDGGSPIYAYDLACPHCDRASTRVDIDAKGYATCPSCGAVYDLNNGGIVIKGSGRPLYRYRITQSSIFSIYIHN